MIEEKKSASNIESTEIEKDGGEKDNKYMDRVLILDSIRGLAALWVFIYHFGMVYGWKTFGMFQEVIRNGFFGVETFFIISGVTLSYVYYSSPFTVSSFLKFVRNRIARLYPLVFLLITIVFLFFELFPIKDVGYLTEHGKLGDITFSKYFKDILMVDFIWSRHYPILPVFWTIDAEFWGSIVFALFFFFTQKLHRYVRVLLFLTIISYLVFKSYYLFFDWFRFIFHFAYGIIIYFLLRKILFQGGKTRWSITFLQVLFTALFFFTLTFIPEVRGHYKDYPVLHALVDKRLFFLDFCFGYPFYLFMLLMVLSLLLNGHIKKLLSLPFFVHFGNLSYSIYAIHAIVLYLLSPILFKKHIPLWSLLINFLVVWSLSFLIYRFFEMPMRVKIKEWIKIK